MTRILIVDDREDSRYLLNTLLKSNGFAVESASHGADALDKALQNQPQLVISDLLMPVMDGYTLLRHWRADAGLKQIPFVVYTATYTDPKDEQLALSLGADAFILKPTEPADLVARIQQVLAHPAAGGTVAPRPLAAGGPPARIPVAAPQEEETKNLRQYSQVLVHKLEDKMQESDRVRRELEHDIAERKQIQQRLLESERKYRELVEHANSIILRWTCDGRITFLNEFGQKFFGYSAGEILGRHIVGTILPEPEDTARNLRPLVERITADPKAFEQNVNENICSDGRRVWIAWTNKPVLDEQGWIQEFLSIGTDITAHRQMEEAHARLATAVEQVAEAIVITDTNGIILYVNPAFETITGYTQQEVIGQNPRILKSGKHDRDFYRRMWDSIAQGKVWSGRLINKKKNGELCEEETTISPIRDSAGKIISYVAVKRDVTQEVALEAQVRQSQKMEAIGQLSGGVAHDFNNILTVIQGHVSLMGANQGLPKELRESVAEVGHAVQRAANLTRQLLAFSRRQTMQLKTLDLNEVVTHMTRMLKRILGEDITMRLHYAPQPAVVLADTGMMEQLVLNLAVNSRDAMPKGGQLDIETSVVQFDELAAAQMPQGRAGSFVCLSVSDTGCGIPQDVISRIFDPFFTTKDVGKGTGLGLATVYGIVQQHQGWINLSSEVGKGTTFRIYLPRSARLAEEQPARLTQVSTRGGNETILLAEDEASLRCLVRNVLKCLGYEVLEASSGVKALELWQQHHDQIRLLLTDMVMPDGVSGTDLAQRLHEHNPRLQVIYISGYSADIAGRNFALEAGVNFLAKPFNPHQLAQLVRDCLDKPSPA